MKCHLTVPADLGRGIVHVLVEGHGVTVDDRAHGFAGQNNHLIFKAVCEYLAETGASHRIAWFEIASLSKIRFRAVKHPLGDSYETVAVVPVRIEVAS